MNILCRSRTLGSLVCRKSSSLVQSNVSTCANLASKARCPRHTGDSSSCHWRQGASLRCPFESRRISTDRGGSAPPGGTEGLKKETEEVEENRVTVSPHNQRLSNVFTLDVLVSLLRQENAVDLCVIKVPDHIRYAEYFIVVSGVSPRHLRAMALYAIKVYKFLREGGQPHVKIEGKDAEDWMCIDFGNMIVHFMLPETREVYELEKLWTLRAFDEQLKKMPAETLPEDFIFDAELTK